MKDITVFSWPYQWLYWPAYRALELLEEEGHYRFIFETNSAEGAFSNDAEIRSRLLENGGDNAIALCAPFEGDDQSVFRQIPVVCRLPHWEISNDDRGLSTLEDSRIIAFCKFHAADFELDGEASHHYPTKAVCGPYFAMEEESTSGDYARLLYPDARLDLLDMEAFLERKKSASGVAITFTPLHEFAPSTMTKHTEYTGPSGIVSAFLIRDKELYDALLEKVLSVLDSLETTRGDLSYIHTLLSIRSPIAMGLRENLKMPTWLRVSGSGPFAVAQFLASYLRRGAYFPYNLLSSTLGRDIGNVVGVSLKESHDIILRKAKEEFRNRFSSNKKWSTLSFGERASAHTNIHISRNVSKHLTGSETSLGSLIRHARIDSSHLKPETLLTDVWVGSAQTSLDRYFDSSGHLVCRENNLDGTDPPRCPPIKRGVFRPSDRDAGEPCFLCTLYGSTPAIAIRAGNYIYQRAAQDKEHWDLDNFEIVLNTNHGQGHPTLLCWEDIAGVLEIFCNEMREPEENEAPGVMISFVAIKGREKFATSMLVGVWWRGKTTSRGDQTGSTNALPAWARKRLERGSPVKGVSFWKRSRDLELDNLKQWDWLSPKALPENSRAIEMFRETLPELEAGKYNFAYLMEFDWNEWINDESHLS